MTWCLVYTKPQRETLALSKLTEQGFVGYLQMRTVEKRLGQKSSIRSVPLFPRYLFIDMDALYEQKKHAIRSTPGVRDLIKSGGFVSTIDDALVDGVRLLECDYLGRVESIYQAGEKVIINNALMHQVEAIFQCDEGEQRALLLIQLLHTPTHIRLDKSQLTKIS